MSQIVLSDWPEDVTVIKYIGHDGEPSPNDRYVYAKVQVGNDFYFYKERKTSETGGGFENDLAWMEYMTKVKDTFPSLHVRAATPYSHKVDTLLTEYIEAPVVSLPEQLHEMSEAEISRISDTLVALDNVGLGYVSTLSSRSGKTVFDQLDVEWDSWYRRLRPELREKYSQHVHRARDIIKNAPKLEPSMQHGDFVPWHIFDSKSDWIIFDAEHAHHEWPRFYDLAYCYSRIYSRSEGNSISGRILSQFIDKIDMPESEFWSKFMPVLTTRAVGVLSDAFYDQDKNDYENTALKLLEICLRGDNKKLISDDDLQK